MILGGAFDSGSTGTPYVGVVSAANREETIIGARIFASATGDVLI